MNPRPLNLGPQYAVDINFDKVIYMNTTCTIQVTRERQTGERTEAQPTPDMKIVLECYNASGIIISSHELGAITGLSWSGLATIEKDTMRASLRLVYPFGDTVLYPLRYGRHEVVISIDPTNLSIPDYGEKRFVFGTRQTEPPIYRFTMVQRSLAASAGFTPPVAYFVRKTVVRVTVTDYPAGLPFGYYVTLVARSNDFDTTGRLVHFGPEGAAAAHAKADADGVPFNPFINNGGSGFVMGTSPGSLVPFPSITKNVQGKSVDLFAVPPNSPYFDIGIWYADAAATTGHAYDYIALHAFRARNLPPVGMSSYRVDPYQPFRVSSRLQGGANLPVTTT